MLSRFIGALILRHQHIDEAEGHLQFGGEFEIGAVEVQADTHLCLYIMRIQLEFHITCGSVLLLSGNHIEAILSAGDNVSA